MTAITTLSVMLVQLCAIGGITMIGLQSLISMTTPSENIILGSIVANAAIAGAREYVLKKHADNGNGGGS